MDRTDTIFDIQCAILSHLKIRHADTHKLSAASIPSPIEVNVEGPKKLLAAAEGPRLLPAPPLLDLEA